MKTYLTKIIPAVATMAMVGLCLIALADGCARQDEINRAATAQHLENNR